MELSSQVLNKTFDGVVKVLPLPKGTDKVIITAKNIITNDVIQDKVKSVFNKLIGNDNKSIDNLDNVKEVLEEKGFMTEIKETLDAVIQSAKKSKLIDKNTSDLLSSSKDIIIEKLIKDETKSRFEGQEKVLKTIDEKYNKWEQAFNNNDTKAMDKLYNQIEKQYERLLPTLSVVEKVNEIKNLNELAKNKLEVGINEITDLEKEICRKAG